MLTFAKSRPIGRDATDARSLAAYLPRVVAAASLLWLGFGAFGATFAQDEGADPPARVGRLSFVDGTVSLRVDGDSDWQSAEINYPMSNGAAVWTEPDSRATVSVGGAAFRAGEKTEISVEDIDLHIARLHIDEGHVNIRLFTLPEGDNYEVVTPRGVVTLLAAGIYRIDAGTDSEPTVVTVFDGMAGFAGGEVMQQINAGQALSASGEEPLRIAVASARQAPLDEWAAARDEQAKKVVENAAPVPPEVTGYRDLNSHGSWTRHPSYGHVWFPTGVEPDWAPYRQGHWANVPPWGWTWIDEAPWGFTPFHYGRWVQIEGRWGWAPGEIAAAPPVYAPALVAFVGAPGVSVGVGIGPRGGVGIGWVPLGFHDPFIPYFPASRRYVQNVNVTHVSVTNITIINNRWNGRPGSYVMPMQRYENFNSRAATFVPRESFGARTSAAKAAVKVDAAALKSARPVAATSGKGGLPQQKPAAAEAKAAPRPVATKQLAVKIPPSKVPAKAVAGKPATGLNKPAAKPGAAAAPEKPAAKTPEKPAAKAPEKPAAKAPEKPAAKTPAKPAPKVKTPEKPAAKTPAKPAPKAKAPEKPAAKPPVKPAPKAKAAEKPAAKSAPKAKAAEKPAAKSGKAKPAEGKKVETKSGD